MTKTAPEALDLSARSALLCADLVERLPEFNHIQPSRVLFCLSRSRAAGLHGTYAHIVPLRFAGGVNEQTRHRGRLSETYRLPALRHGGEEILYLIYLLVPRFLRLSAAQKLNTLIHELYHISETCNGDIRRFAGRNFAHGSSRRAYNRLIAEFAERYRASAPDPALLAFLSATEDDWLAGRLHVTGLSVPRPRVRLVARTRR